MLIFHNIVNIGGAKAADVASSKGCECEEPEDGDEIASDSFPYTIIDGVCYRFRFRRRTDKVGEDFDIGANASQEEACESTESSEACGLDCVMNHQLVPVPTINSKSEFKQYIKSYGKALKPILEKKYSDADVVKDRLTKLSKVFMELVKDYDNLEFYCGMNYNYDGTILVVRWVEDTPYGYLPLDGVFDEKQ